MCLDASKAATLAFKKENPSGTIKVFKAYTIENNELKPPHYPTGAVKPGEIVSNRLKKTVDWQTGFLYDESTGKYLTGAKISEGIHVYLTKKGLDKHIEEYLSHKTYGIVTLEADMADLVAVGKDRYRNENDHAVFMKVYLPEDQYRKHVPYTAEEKKARRSAASKKAAATRKRKAAGIFAARSAAAKKAAETRRQNKLAFSPWGG